MDKDIEKLQNEVNEIANQIEKLCKIDMNHQDKTSYNIYSVYQY